MIPRAAFALAAVVALPAHAGTVHTDVGEARACLPLDGGGALVGTGGGLVALDAAGAHLATWTAADGLPGTRIEAIVPLGDDLWIGTDAGAARVRVASHRLTITRTVASRGVRDLVRLGDTTYLATWGDGVHALTATATRAVPFRAASRTAQRRDVTALAVAHGTLYAATATGLYRLAAGALAPVPLALPPATRITSLHGDATRLWLATTDGLFVREGTTLRALGGGDLRRVTALDDAIVVASAGDGLARVERGRLVRLPDAPRALAVAQALASRTVTVAGARVHATCAGGLDGAWLRPRPDAPWLAAARPAGPPSNDISALAADGARLWVGTFDRGLAVRERGAWRALAHPELDARINALHVERRADGTSRLWIATAAGLHVLDGQRLTRLTRADGLPSRSVLSVTGLRDGRVLAGTSAGAALIRDGRATRLGPPQLGNVWAVAEDAAGHLWLGTTTGLYRGAADAPFERFSLATGHLRDDWVMALTTRGTSVWAGTYKGGITRFDGDAATHVADGWINPSGLAFDGDTLLAATMDGLLPASPRLPGRDVTATARIGATLYVATRRGLAELR